MTIIASLLVFGIYSYTNYLAQPSRVETSPLPAHPQAPHTQNMDTGLKPESRTPHSGKPLANLPENVHGDELHQHVLWRVDLTLHALPLLSLALTFISTE